MKKKYKFLLNDGSMSHKCEVVNANAYRLYSCILCIHFS